MATLLLPALGRVSLKATTAQTAADQAALACALERYRLANGRFPEDLNALVPRFTSQLPHDALTGEPYKYRRAEDGRFALYSVGWNEKDDGGVPGKVLFDDKQGDWVWNYAAK
jgi:type II secretory pathway pseudopilin PulG